mmetsp:Transcript_18969/g.58888  ORF Transcript_18969/g.58888 Transcript_18969/m.58888 type:complete len:205 (-) Transcript_18969:117-731(-)
MRSPTTLVRLINATRRRPPRHLSRSVPVRFRIMCHVRQDTPWPTAPITLRFAVKPRRGQPVVRRRTLRRTDCIVMVKAPRCGFPSSACGPPLPPSFLLSGASARELCSQWRQRSRRSANTDILRKSGSSAHGAQTLVRCHHRRPPFSIRANLHSFFHPILRSASPFNSRPVFFNGKWVSGTLGVFFLASFFGVTRVWHPLATFD